MWKNGRLNVWYQEIKLPNNSLIPEDRFVIICNRRRNFEQYYNTSCDIKATQNVFSNGNDVIAIVNGFTTPNLDYEIIDTYGEIGVDITDEIHNFQHGRAVRKTSVTTAKLQWNKDDWIVKNDLSIYDMDPRVWNDPSEIPSSKPTVNPSSVPSLN